MKKIFLFALIMGVGVAFGQEKSTSLSGSFISLKTPPSAHSLKRVQYDEYFNFTCPHCNTFRQQGEVLHKKYGKKLQVNYIPVLFPNQNPEALRLFFVAQSLGKTEMIKALIFDATFVSNVNIYDPAIVSYLARSAGIHDTFFKYREKQWVSDKILAAQYQARNVGVEATPTVVLAEAMLLRPRQGMRTFVSDLDTLIEGLLEK